MKTITTLITCALLSFHLFAQNVNIPDANFKDYLINNNDIDTNNDDEIQVSEAAAYTEDITCYSCSISDLTGIEAFTNLTRLVVSSNQITSVNLSWNSSLEFLNFRGNPISSIDLSFNTALKEFACGQSDLTNFVAPTTNTLTILDINSSSLTSIDISGAPGVPSKITGLDERHHNKSIRDVQNIINLLLRVPMKNELIY